MILCSSSFFKLDGHLVNYQLIWTLVLCEVKKPGRNIYFWIRLGVARTQILPDRHWFIKKRKVIQHSFSRNLAEKYLDYG